MKLAPRSQVCTTRMPLTSSQILWVSLAVQESTDYVSDTDVAPVMFLPIRLTWNLQMPRGQKIGVFILFGTGFICIAFATLRVVQIGVEGGKVVSPDPRWMSLWTVVETSMGKSTFLLRLPTF